MRAREFINEQVVPAVGSVVKDTAKNVAKDATSAAWKVGNTALDKYYNVLGYSKGANMDLPDPLGVGVNKATGSAPPPPPPSNKRSSEADFVKDQALWNLGGRLAQGAGTLASKLPAVARFAPALGQVGKFAMTGTGPVGTAAALAVRSGDAGRAYGPEADTVTGREEWMTKHGYDPKKPGESQRAMKDYNQAKANWEKQPMLTKLNQKLNPFTDDDTEDDDAIMKYKDK